jgi:hypothetical protein
MKVRICLVCLCALSLFACKNNEDISSLPEPSILEKQWMEQSWLEYIVEVKGIHEFINRETINKNIKDDFFIEKIKPFEKNKYVITLSKKTKYKSVYKSLMPLKPIKTIQPNFSYFTPQPAFKLNMPDTR